MSVPSCRPALLLIVPALLLSACGSGSDEPTEAPAHRAHHPAPETKAAQTEPTPEAEPDPIDAPLEYVGTMTAPIEEGAYMKERFQLGPLIYGSEGSPPPEALEACGFFDGRAGINASVFARGSLDMTYTKGTLPISISLGYSNEAVGGEGLEGSGYLEYDVGGTWNCSDEAYGPPSVEFEPGKSQHIPFWFIGLDVLSNSQPKLFASEYDKWYFYFLGPLYGENVNATGPGTATCYNEENHTEIYSLYLFSRNGQC